MLNFHIYFNLIWETQNQDPRLGESERLRHPWPGIFLRNADPQLGKFSEKSTQLRRSYVPPSNRDFPPGIATILGHDKKMSWFPSSTDPFFEGIKKIGIRISSKKSFSRGLNFFSTTNIKDVKEVWKLRVLRANDDARSQIIQLLRRESFQTSLP